MTGPEDPGEVLAHGELSVLGRIRSASNATFLCDAALDDTVLRCVYKPVLGEQPLWDFPDGTLAGRERAAYLISTALGWNIVPHTIIRDGPAGEGMVQSWVQQPEEPDGVELVDLCSGKAVPAGHFPIIAGRDYDGTEVTLTHADDPRLRRMAVFDVVVNNADRKGGHILTGADGRVYGIDHGVCLHAQNKLRTVLWGWAGEPVDDETVCALGELDSQLAGPLGAELGVHITAEELSALRRRVQGLIEHPLMPGPNARRPLPWPPF